MSIIIFLLGLSLRKKISFAKFIKLVILSYNTLCSMARNGKIAHLARDIRNELNRCLDDGEPGTHVLEWLNALEDVQRILDESSTVCPSAAAAYRAATGRGSDRFGSKVSRHWLQLKLS